MTEKESYEEEHYDEERDELSDDELFLTLKIEVDNLKRQLKKWSDKREEYIKMEKNYRNVVPKNDVNNLLFASDVIFDTSVKIIRLFKKITRDDLVDIHLNKKEFEVKEVETKDELRRSGMPSRLNDEFRVAFNLIKPTFKESQEYKKLSHLEKMKYIRALQLYMLKEWNKGNIDLNKIIIPETSIVLNYGKEVYNNDADNG